MNGAQTSKSWDFKPMAMTHYICINIPRTSARALFKPLPIWLLISAAPMKKCLCEFLRVTTNKH